MTEISALEMNKLDLALTAADVRRAATVTVGTETLRKLVALAWHEPDLRADIERLEQKLNFSEEGAYVLSRKLQDAEKLKGLVSK